MKLQRMTSSLNVIIVHPETCPTPTIEQMILNVPVDLSISRLETLRIIVTLSGVIDQIKTPIHSTRDKKIFPTLKKPLELLHQLKRSSGNAELYSMDELCEILQETVVELMACTNKAQQIKVLCKLFSNAIK